MPLIALDRRPDADAQRTRLFWACVVLLSMAGRLAALDVLSGRVIGGDHAIYVALAQNLLDGHGYVVDDVNTMANMRATYPPVYPMLLAIAGLFLPITFATIALVNTLIDLACAWLLWKVTCQLAPRSAAMAAAAIYLAWPGKLAAAPVAQKEGLIALLVVGLLLALIRSIERPIARRAAVYGLLSGLLALTQPGLAPLPAIFLLVTMRKFRRADWLRFAVVAAAAAAATLLPWLVRNWWVFGRFVPLTSAGGYGLWVGATPQGDGTWTAPPEAFRKGDEFEMSAALAKEAWRIIVADPGRFIVHGFNKLVRAFSVEGAATDLLHHAIPQPPTTDVSKAWRFAATIVYFATLWLGLASALLRPRHLFSLFLFAGLLQVLLFGIWLEFGERHRHFLTPLLLLGASANLVEAIRSPGDDKRKIQQE